MASPDALAVAEDLSPGTGAAAPATGEGSPSGDPSAVQADVSETPKAEGAGTPELGLRDVLDELKAAITGAAPAAAPGEPAAAPAPQAGPVTQHVETLLSEFEGIVAREKAAFDAIGYKDPETGAPLEYAESPTERFLVNSLRQLAEKIDAIVHPLQTTVEEQVAAQQASHIRGLVEAAATEMGVPAAQVGSYVQKYGPAWQHAMSTVGQLPARLGDLTAAHIRRIVEYGKHLEGAGPSTAQATNEQGSNGKPTPAPVTRGGAPGGRTSDQTEDDLIRKDLGL